MRSSLVSANPAPFCSHSFSLLIPTNDMVTLECCGDKGFWLLAHFLGTLGQPSGPLIYFVFPWGLRGHAHRWEELA